MVKKISEERKVELEEETPKTPRLPTHLREELAELDLEKSFLRGPIVSKLLEAPVAIAAIGGAVFFLARGMISSVRENNKSAGNKALNHGFRLRVKAQGIAISAIVLTALWQRHQASEREKAEKEYFNNRDQR